MSRKRVNSGVRSFDKLPPRVIIFDIFSFYMKNLRSLGTGDESFDLFGYFKLDRLRSIWFLFTSLYLKPFLIGGRGRLDDSNYSGYYAEMKKIGFLGIQAGIHFVPLIKDICAGIIKMSPDFYRLKSLNMTYCSLDESIKGFFSRNNSFPKLKDLRINTGYLSHLTSENYGDLFEKLSSFSVRGIGIPTYTNSEFFIKNDFSKYMIKLCLGQIRLDKRVHLELPKLQQIKLKRIHNLFISHCFNLKILSISKTKCEYVKSVMKDTSKLRIIQLKEIDFEIDSNDWLFSEKFCNLTNLERVELIGDGSFLEDNQRISQIEWKRIHHQITKLSLGCSSQFIDLFKFPHPKIEELKISNHIDIFFFDICFTQRIKKLELFQIHIFGMKFVDLNFFKDQQWSCLEVLYMKECYESLFFNPYGNDDDFNDDNQITTTTTTTNPRKFQFPKLKHLSLDDIGTFSSGFLRLFNLSQLETLLLLDTRGNLQGPNKWDIKFTKLNKITVFHMKDLDDEFFSDNEFPVLQTICFTSCVNMKGRNWNIKNCDFMSMVRIDEENFTYRQELEERGVTFYDDDVMFSNEDGRVLIGMK